MRKIVFAIASLGILFSGSVQAQAKFFDIKSGHVEYKLSGNTEGTKSFYWDDFGVKQYTLERSETTIEMFGIKDVQKKHMLTIQNGGDIYTVDYITDYAAHTDVSSQMEMNAYMQSSHTEAQKEDMRDETLASLGGEITGTETVLGRTCEIMEMAGSKSWIYKQVILKSETSLMGVTNNETATSMEENISIPASKFQPPAGVEFQSSGNDLWSDDEDEMDEDAEPLPITLDQFCNAVNKAKSESFMINNCSNMEGTYMVMGISKGQMVMISPGNIANVDLASDELPESAEHLSINGHQAIFASQVYDEETGEHIDMPLLMVKYPAKSVFITIVTTGDLSKADLVNIAKKIKF